MFKLHEIARWTDPVDGDAKFSLVVSVDESGKTQYEVYEVKVDILGVEHLGESGDIDYREEVKLLGDYINLVLLDKSSELEEEEKE